MMWQKIIMVSSLLLLVIGCRESNLSTGSMRKKHVEREEILAVAQGVDVGLSDPDSVVVGIAAQILEIALRRYRDAGCDEAMLDNNMHQSPFTDNLRRLYYDMRPIMERQLCLN